MNSDAGVGKTVLPARGQTRQCSCINGTQFHTSSRQTRGIIRRCWRCSRYHQRFLSPDLYSKRDGAAALPGYAGGDAEWSMWYARCYPDTVIRDGPAQDPLQLPVFNHACHGAREASRNVNDNKFSLVIDADHQHIQRPERVGIVPLFTPGLEAVAAGVSKRTWSILSACSMACITVYLLPAGQSAVTIAGQGPAAGLPGDNVRVNGEGIQIRLGY